MIVLMSTRNSSYFYSYYRSELIPFYESAKFDIIEFRKISQDKEIIYSEELNTNGLIWKLKIYPCGNGVAKNEYISIFLELISVNKL